MGLFDPPSVPRVAHNYAGANPLVEHYTSGAGAAAHRASIPGCTAPYIDGVGADVAGVTGRLTSIKANAIGEQVDQWVLGGIGRFMSAKAPTASEQQDLYPGNLGTLISMKTGRSFGNVTYTLGSNRLTSPTFAATAADNDVRYTPEWPYPNDFGGITAYVKYVNATTIDLVTAPGGSTPVNAVVSRAAVGCGQIAGRAPDTTQGIRQVRDTNGTTVLFRERYSDWTAALPLIARDTGTANLTVLQIGSQAGDQTRWRSSGGVTETRINKGNYFMTLKSSAPADADLSNGEVSVWTDPANSAARFQLKSKETGGTVRSVYIPLSPVTLAAAATDAATTQTLVNDIRSKLIATGSYA